MDQIEVVFYFAAFLIIIIVVVIVIIICARRYTFSFVFPSFSILSFHTFISFSFLSLIFGVRIITGFLWDRRSGECNDRI